MPDAYWAFFKDQKKQTRVQAVLATPDGFRPLPQGDILVLTRKRDGTFVCRYTLDGRFGGDWWYPTIKDAFDANEESYGDDLSEWMEIPLSDSEDSPTGLSFERRALAWVLNRLNEIGAEHPH